MLQSDSSIFKSNETPEDVVRLSIPQVNIPAIDVYLLPLTNNLDLLIIPKL